MEEVGCGRLEPHWARSLQWGERGEAQKDRAALAGWKARGRCRAGEWGLGSGGEGAEGKVLLETRAGPG